MTTSEVSTTTARTRRTKTRRKKRSETSNGTVRLRRTEATSDVECERKIYSTRMADHANLTMAASGKYGIDNFNRCLFVLCTLSILTVVVLLSKQYFSTSCYPFVHRNLGRRFPARGCLFCCQSRYLQMNKNAAFNACTSFTWKQRHWFDRGRILQRNVVYIVYRFLGA